MAQREFISIQEAAEISQKSVQTIRRALKSKKLKHRKRKTPQGFNYLISRESLFEVYNLDTAQEAPVQETAVNEDAKSEVNAVQEEAKSEVAEVQKEEKAEESLAVSASDFKDFKESFEKMIANHSEERQNFLRLINTLQEKIFVMENQINLLQAPKKRWYQVWK